MTLDVDWGLIGTLSGALIGFAIGYNNLIGKLDEQGYLEGYTSLAVVGGVLVTLIAVAVVDLEAALLAFWAFCCTGTPMVIGSCIRHVRRRRASQQSIKGE